MAKFKVGDKVRISGIGAAGLAIGTLAKVTRVDGVGDVWLDNGSFYLRSNVELASTKYRTEKRKANVGERILITNAGWTFGDYDNGDVLTVVDSFGKDAVLVDGEDFPQITHEEYEVIIEAKPSKSERISLLESQVAELQAKVEALEKPKETTVNNVTITSPTINSYDDLARLLDRMPKMPSPNEQRKAVIKRAKAFVKDTINEYQLSDSEITFVVDDKKRSVSVTLSHLFSGLAITKAIAKCAPDDVFNADIGKAIALGRALGLDVSEFENAVKPTELVVGHVITKVNGPNGLGRICKVENGKAYNDGPGSWWRIDLAYNNTLIGLDDTKAEY